MSNHGKVATITTAKGQTRMADRWEHGTSKWADVEELKKAEMLDNNGVPLGYKLRNPKSQNREWTCVGYTGDQHMLTVAPTRSGKGTCAIVPTLMEHFGGVLCIDPKGENAIITAEARKMMHYQKVHILDPWGLACEVLGQEAAQFNPLDMLDPKSPDLVDDALMIADALVVAAHSDSFWSDEARAMIMGFILYLVTSPKEEGRRTLGRLREILSLAPADFMAIVHDMAATKDNKLVMNAGNRITQKSERELASVISTAQQNTHFLESLKIQKSLEQTTFDFADLKADKNPITVYLVLPADRLNTHGRWLRLIVSMAITAIVRTKGKPRTPALFILDEFAALGKLAVVEQAYGLMAGFGMTIWAILQDLSQLQDLYDRRWQTFIANAGVLQAFGTRDTFTADYLSKLCGQTTVETISVATGERRKGGIFTSADPNYSSMNDRQFGRPLMMPEEIMRLPKDNQLLFLPEMHPLAANKVPYYENARFFNEGSNTAIFRVHPDFEGLTMPFYIYDSETRKRFGSIDQRREDEAKKEENERKAKARAELQKQRDEAMQQAAAVGKSALKSAGKFAKFMGEKLSEGQKKMADDAKKDEGKTDE